MDRFCQVNSLVVRREASSTTSYYIKLINLSASRKSPSEQDHLNCNYNIKAQIAILCQFFRIEQENRCQILTGCYSKANIVMADNKFILTFQTGLT